MSREPQAEADLCPACHHRDHQPGGCSLCPYCELHTDDALAFVLRVEPALVGNLITRSVQGPIFAFRRYIQRTYGDSLDAATIRGILEEAGDLFPAPGAPEAGRG